MWNIVNRFREFGHQDGTLSKDILAHLDSNIYENRNMAIKEVTHNYFHILKLIWFYANEPVESCKQGSVWLTVVVVVTVIIVQVKLLICVLILDVFTRKVVFLSKRIFATNNPIVFLHLAMDINSLL